MSFGKTDCYPCCKKCTPLTCLEVCLSFSIIHGHVRDDGDDALRGRDCTHDDHGHRGDRSCHERHDHVGESARDRALLPKTRLSIGSRHQLEKRRVDTTGTKSLLCVLRGPWEGL